MRQAICFIYWPLRLLIILVLSPILTLLYWFVFFPLLIPFHLFRHLLSIIVRFRDPDVCKIVDRFSHVASRDFAEWHTKPSHCVTTIFTLSGDITIEELRQLLCRSWVHKTTGEENHCQLEYPELQQYYTKRLGFLFFKWDRTFDISNHVNVYSDKVLLPNPETDVVNEAKIMRIWESLMTKPYMDKQSPWEVLLIPRRGSCQNKMEGMCSEKSLEGHCILFLRIHHGLCDGASMYKLLLTITDNGLVNLCKDIASFKKAPACMDLYLNLSGFFCGPASIIKRLSKGLDIYNPLHPPLGKLTGKHRIVKSKLELETVKKIARLHLDVSIHSVLIAALSGGIRNYLLANGHSIPLSPIRLGIPIPKPGHSLKLRNEYLISLLDLPVEKKTPKERLFACEKRLNALHSESIMPFLVQLLKLIGGLPVQLVRLLSLKSSVTVMYSEIKGPSVPLTVMEGNHEVLELLFSFGLGTDDLGVAFNSISFKDKIYIMLTIDQGVCKTIVQAEQLLTCIENEFKDLQYGDSTYL